MLTLDDKQRDLLDGWNSPEMLALSPELAFADQALDDPRALAPFRKGAASTGRPSIPIATYLRMMYLKHRYQVSYALLVNPDSPVGREDRDGKDGLFDEQKSAGRSRDYEQTFL